MFTDRAAGASKMSWHDRARGDAARAEAATLGHPPTDQLMSDLKNRQRRSLGNPPAHEPERTAWGDARGWRLRLHRLHAGRARCTYSTDHVRARGPSASASPRFRPGARALPVHCGDAHGDAGTAVDRTVATWPYGRAAHSSASGWARRGRRVALVLLWDVPGGGRFYADRVSPARDRRGRRAECGRAARATPVLDRHVQLSGVRARCSRPTTPTRTSMDRA